MKGHDGEKKISKLLKMSEKCRKVQIFPALHWLWLVCQPWARRVKHPGDSIQHPCLGSQTFWKKSQFFHGLLKKHCPLHPKKYQNFPTFLRKPGSSWLLTLYSIFPIYLKRSPKNYQKVRVYALAMELKVSRNASRTKRIQHRHQAWNNLGMRSCARSWHKIRKRLRVRAHSKRVFLLYTAVP